MCGIVLVPFVAIKLCDLPVVEIFAFKDAVASSPSMLDANQHGTEYKCNLKSANIITELFSLLIE